MAVPEDYLKYAKRAHGMDHDRYDWSMLPDREPIAWPGGARQLQVGPFARDHVADLLGRADGRRRL